MPDPVPPPAPPSKQSWVGPIMSRLLPPFIKGSRKALVWFSSLGASGVLELCKQIGQFYGWSEVQIASWNNRMLLLQGVILLVAKFWTDQIALEDQAHKTGLPPPQPMTRVTTTVEAPPAPDLPRGEGD